MESHEQLFEKREQLLEFFEVKDLLHEIFDSAIIGYVERAGGTRFVLYDEEKMFEWFGTETLPEKKFILLLTKAGRDEISDMHLIATGFDDAIIGYAKMHEGESIVIYDSEKCIKILSDDSEESIRLENKDMTEEELQDEIYSSASDCFYFNTIDAYVGEKPQDLLLF